MKSHICESAGKYPECTGCDHSKPHTPRPFFKLEDDSELELFCSDPTSCTVVLLHILDGDGKIKCKEIDNAKTQTVF